MENNDDLNELIKRAEEDKNDNSEGVVVDDNNNDDDEFVTKFQNNSADFGDYFHERDRLDHNNKHKNIYHNAKQEIL